MNTEKYGDASAHAGAAKRELPMARWLLAFAFSSMSFACNGPTMAPAVRRPDGGWHVACGASLDACVNRATRFCKERGFVVLGGMSKRTIYGAELGISQIAVHEAELDFVCADRRGYLPQVQPACTPVPPPAPVGPAP